MLNYYKVSLFNYRFVKQFDKRLLTKTLQYGMVMVDIIGAIAGWLAGN